LSPSGLGAGVGASAIGGAIAPAAGASALGGASDRELWRFSSGGWKQNAKVRGKRTPGVSGARSRSSSTRV
jgi:hypothetical protein